MTRQLWFESGVPSRRFGWGDLVVVLVIATLLYVGVRLAFAAPLAIQGPDIHLSLAALPWYATLSLSRMFAAYVLSLLFTLIYGYIAAYNRDDSKALITLEPEGQAQAYPR